MEHEGLSTKETIRYGVFFLFVLFSLFIVYLVLTRVIIQEDPVLQGDVNNTSGSGFFNPPSHNDSEKTVSGKITYSSDNVPDYPVKHRLVDENDNTIAYIYSSNNNLDLSLGFTVFVTGNSQGAQYNGVDIVEVTSIKLK